MAYLKLERLVEYEQEWVVELYKNMHANYEPIHFIKRNKSILLRFI